jgi:PhzF family phenazine biosynthesis protein
MSVAQPVYVVDAFSDRPFGGNPAAVCPLDTPASGVWMQSVAAEMNLSETAFVIHANGRWNLRWLTPTVEVDLCGHATLAAAHVLWESGRSDNSQPLQFRSRSGTLTVVWSKDGYQMDFPALPVEAIPMPTGFSEAIGAEPVWIGTNGMDLFAEVADEATLRSLRPDSMRIASYPVRGVIVTARAAEWDFVSRFFGPGSGVPEDPVTGSAHCALGPYWAHRLGRSELIGFQASSRGGQVRVSVCGKRVKLGGNAVTVLRGELDVPRCAADDSWLQLVEQSNAADSRENRAV